MGEYAIRKSDNKSIKIGTCEDMYYLRYEDRDKVTCEEGSDFGCRWRLPLPSEDHMEPGEYHPYCHGDGSGTVPLGRAYAVGDNGEDEITYFEPNPEVVDHPGSMQLHHKSGLLINVKCFHGLKLPEAGGDITRTGWNGHANHWELRCLRETKEGLLPVVACRYCGHMYRETWAAVLPFITDKELHRRLQSYAITLAIK